MYKAAITDKTGNFRPWNTRLGAARGMRGLGVYSPGEFVSPTWSEGVFQRTDYPFMSPVLGFKAGIASVPNVTGIAAPAPPKGVSGMGLDLSSLTSQPLLLLGGAVAVWYFFFRKR
jgi:hypothetical protein